MTPFFRFLHLLLAAGLILSGGSLRAQGVVKQQGLTAQEYLDQAGRLYLDGKYAEAAKAYEEFERDYGKSTEAAPLLRNTRFRYAMSLVQLKKYSEAIDAINTALAVTPPLQPAEIQELRFWLGVCQIEDKEYGSARESFDKFLALFPAGAERNPGYINQFPAARRIPEARLLIGNAWMLEENYLEAAKYFGALKGGTVTEDRGRAMVLQLYSLLQENDEAAAMKLVTEEYPRMSDLTQLVTFQTLVLELGNRWLEKGEYRKAIICLQRVWSSDRLIKHQEERLKDLEIQMQAAEANPKSDVYNKLMLSQLIQKVKRELENFQKIQSFDAALRLRLATAYQAMKRYREAALILEEMLATLPPDKIVEQASVNLVQSWFEIERWPKVTESAHAFLEKFPKSASVPLVLYIEGIAEQKDLRFDESIAAFQTILEKHPESELAPRALFMKGFTQLLAERNEEAIKTFSEFPKKYSNHELLEASYYWLGMAYSLNKEFAKSREAMDDYIRRYPEGQFTGSAVFRKAYCAQQMEDYQMSIRELRTYMRKYPGHEENSEARVLLGDALMNEGEMEEGIAAFKGISKSDTRFYEEGVFKVGKALKLMEEYDRYLALMQDFQKENPRSPRVAEAIYNMGWIYRQKEKPLEAREAYWQAIQEHGDDPSIRSVEDLFPALSKLYKGEGSSEQYLALLRDLQQSAVKSSKTTLAMRAIWAQAQAVKKSNPELYNKLLLEASAYANVQTTNPMLLADFAEALLASGREAEGEQMSRDLVKWNPRAPQKDRALANLGFLELKRGDEKAALDLFTRFQKESLGSLVSGRVLLAKAALLKKRGEKEKALADLEAVLANKYSSGSEKAQALYEIGEIHMAAGKPELAVPYYQRIYVMHGRWGEWVAKAYYRSGEAFEKLNDTLSARKTYQELETKEDLTRFPEYELAKDRLKSLGGPLPKEDPQG